MIVSSSALAANIEATATKLDTPLPEAFTTAVGAARALPRSIDFGAAIDLQNQAAIVALTEGRDPAVCPQVQRWVTARSLHEQGLRAAAERWAGEQITELIAEHADAIVAGWAKAIRPDLDTLQGAAGHLDMRDLNSCDPVVLKKENKLSLWADASSAAERADTALAGLRAVLRAMNYGYDGEASALLLAPSADWPTVTAIYARAGRQLTAWSIAKGGTELALPTVTQYARAIARVTAERQERERQAEADAEAEARTGRARKREWVRAR